MFGIGGGGNDGGGFLGGLGQLLDPAGIVTGGGGGGGLEALLNPAGAIFGLINGEVQKAQSNNASENAKALETAEKIISFFNSDEVKKFRADLANEKSEGNLGADPSNTAGTTELSPDVHPQGYVQQQRGASASGAADDGTTTDEEGGDAGPVCSSSSAMTAAGAGGVTPQMADEMNTLQALLANFNYLDGGTFGPTGHFDFRNIENVISGPYPEGLKNAAAYLQTHPDFYTKLAALSGEGNGFINRAGIAQVATELSAQAAQGSTQGASASSTTGSGAPPDASGASGSAAPTSKPTTKAEAQAAKAAAHQNGAGSASSPSAPGETAAGPSSGPGHAYTAPPAGHSSIGPSTSFESALDNLATKLGGLESRMDELTDVIINGSAEDARKASAEMSKLQRDFQTISDLRKQMYTLLSDLQKSYHDLAMHAINNTR